VVRQRSALELVDQPHHHQNLTPAPPPPPPLSSVVSLTVRGVAPPPRGGKVAPPTAAKPSVAVREFSTGLTPSTASPPVRGHWPENH